MKMRKDKQCRVSDDHADNADDKADFQPFSEGNPNIPFLFQQAQGHDVGGRSDHADVSAETGTKKQLIFRDGSEASEPI